MKILVLASLTRSLAVFRGALLREMVAAGHEVVACAPEADDGAVAALGVRFEQLPYIRTGTNPFAELRLMRLYCALMRREQPDIVFCYTIKPNVYGAPAARRAGVPRVYIMVTGLGNAFIADGSIRREILRGIARRLYKRAARCSGRVIFQNPDDRRELVRTGIVPEAKAALVDGSGVDLTEYVPMALPERPLFLMVARLLREKGVAEYLAACRLFRQAGGEATCALLGPYEPGGSIGPGDLAPYIEEGSLEYWGETLDIRPYLARCSVLVLPSYREGTPRAVLEAMACGRAVITTDAPGCRETVISGHSGFLVPLRDAQAIADAMLALVRDPERVRQMGQAGLHLCRERYDVVKVNRDMMAIMGLQKKENSTETDGQGDGTVAAAAQWNG